MNELVLVTGGAGYVGSQLVELLLDRGQRVRVLDVLPWGDEPLARLRQRSDLDLVVGDIRCPDDVARALEGCTQVVHLARVVGDPACALDPEATTSINLDATEQLVRAARERGVARFVFASTCSVYGAAEDRWLDERSPLRPLSLYAETNVSSEARVLSGFAGTGTVPCVLRFATVYGASARMRFDLVVNIMTAHAVARRRLQVFGGEQWRPNIHVRDAARAMVQVLEAPAARVHGEVFNVGANEQNYRIGELGALVAGTVPGTDVETLEGCTDARSYRVRFDKIAESLGFRCESRLADGITEIRALLESGAVADYQADRYHNNRYRYPALVNGNGNGHHHGNGTGGARARVSR